MHGIHGSLETIEVELAEYARPNFVDFLTLATAALGKRLRDLESKWSTRHSSLSTVSVPSSNNPKAKEPGLHPFASLPRSRAWRSEYLHRLRARFNALFNGSTCKNGNPDGKSQSKIESDVCIPHPRHIMHKCENKANILRRHSNDTLIRTTPYIPRTPTSPRRPSPSSLPSRQLPPSPSKWPPAHRHLHPQR